MYQLTLPRLPLLYSTASLTRAAARRPGPGTVPCARPFYYVRDGVLVRARVEAGVNVSAGDAIFLRTGRWLRREQLGPWQLYPAPPGEGEAGYHVSVVPWIRSRDVAVVGADVSNDVTPARVGDAVLTETRLMPVHSLVIVAIGGYVVDAMDLEALAETAAKLNRWEFMVTGAPIPAAGGTGALLT